MTENIPDACNQSRIGIIPLDAMQELKEQVIAENSGLIKSIPMPWVNIGGMFEGGMRPGEVTILAGDPGAGKSYLSYSMGLCAGEHDFAWKYLPFEDSAKIHIRRIMALYENNWTLNKMGRINIKEYEAKTEKYRYKIASNVFESPKKPIPYGDGQAWINPTKWRHVVDFVRETAKFCDLLILDPITVIEFEEKFKKVYEGQSKFIGELVATISQTNCHLLLVIHTTKDGVNISGSADFERISHNALIFKGHESLTSKIYDYQNDIEDEVMHKRTLVIQKTRNGSGSKSRVAMDFSENGPRLIEKGLIIGKSK